MTHRQPESVIAQDCPDPRIYLASPLTNLSQEQRRCLGSEIGLVKARIEQLTMSERVKGEAWPVSVYAPFDYTAPWKEDGLSPSQVYERNLSELLDSDAMIVLADKAASAGVGQEIEWATRSGMPILYLSSEESVSRQIAGIPAFITCVAYNHDSGTLTAQVDNFIHKWRIFIQDSPRRRASRRLRLEPLASRLRIAWATASDPTGIGARCGLHPNFIHMALADPARVALMPIDMVCMLCAELGVRLHTSSNQLSIRAMRALILTSIEDSWSDETIGRMRIYGLAATAQDPATDLDTLDAWRNLHAQISHNGS
jgi:hypothetical protein